jgi:hypothetical protein
VTDRLLRQLLEWRDYEYCEGEQPYELLTNAVDYAHDLLTTANTYKAKVAELEAENETGKRAYADLLVNSVREIRVAEARVAEFEAKLADIAGLRRYSLVYDEMQQYDDGVWLKLDDVCQALKEQGDDE